MSRNRSIRLVLMVAVSAWLWGTSASRTGSLSAVIDYSIVGIVGGMALVWIFRSFASLPNNRLSVQASVIAGVFIFTPLAALVIGSTDESASSMVVVALVSGAVSALAGAIRGVAALARGAFGDWRQERLTHKPQLNFGGAHR